MTDDYRFQVSPILPDGTMFNIRSATANEFAADLQWAAENVHKIVDAVDSIKKVGAISQQLPVQQATHEGGWQTPPQAPAPQYAQPQQQGYAPPQQAAPAGPGPSCVHGPRVFKSGTSKSSGKPYKMWACPSRDRNNQCDPEWVRD